MIDRSITVATILIGNAILGCGDKNSTDSEQAFVNSCVLMEEERLICLESTTGGGLPKQSCNRIGGKSGRSCVVELPTAKDSITCQDAGYRIFTTGNTICKWNL